MPQTKVEKKFFRIRVAKNRQNIEAISYKNIAAKEFQQLQKKIAGGEE
jgi:hypothetical protein